MFTHMLHQYSNNWNGDVVKNLLGSETFQSNWPRGGFEWGGFEWGIWVGSGKSSVILTIRFTTCLSILTGQERQQVSL